MVMTGCRSAPPVAAPLDSIEILSPQATVLELPITVPSMPNLCGLSAIEVLTRFHGAVLSDNQRQRLHEAATPKGDIEVAAIADCLRECGFHVAVFSGSLDDSSTGLRQYIQARLPLVVLLGSPTGSSHYILVAGLDPEHGLIIAMDPLRGFLAYPAETFRRQWERCQYATILAVPPSATLEDLDQLSARLADVECQGLAGSSDGVLSLSGGGPPLATRVSLAPLRAHPTLNASSILGLTAQPDNSLTCPKCDFKWWGPEDSSCPKCGETRVLHMTTLTWILIGALVLFTIIGISSAMSASAAAGY